MNIGRPQEQVAWQVQWQAVWRLLSLFHLLCLLLLGLTIFVRFLPTTPDPIPLPDSWEARLWGLWPITYLPDRIYWPAVVLIIVVIVAIQIACQRDRLFQANQRRNASSAPQRNSLTPWLVLCASALFIAFYLFPIVHTRWGDAYILSRSIAWPGLDLRLTHSWQAPLDVRLHSIAWHLLDPQQSWPDAIPVYRLLSPIAGAGYLATALAFARNGAWAPAWLSFGLLVSLGLLQLFFGYVENYSFAAAGILLYLYLALEALDKRRPLRWAALVLAITNGLHPSTIVLAPSMLLCTWFCARRGGNNYWRSLVIDVALPVTAVAVGIVIMMEAGGHGLSALVTSDRPGGSDARWFVPLFSVTTRWEQYTFLSSRHLLDIMNLQLLVAPIILPALVVVGLHMVGLYNWRTHRAQRCSSTHLANHMTERMTGKNPAAESTWFLLIATIVYWLFVWTWNPDYGGQRDRDLFSLSAIPATLLLIDLLPRIIGKQVRLAFAIIPLLLFQSLHTTAWIYQNTLPWEWP